MRYATPVASDGSGMMLGVWGVAYTAFGCTLALARGDQRRERMLEGTFVPDLARLSVVWLRSKCIQPVSASFLAESANVGGRE